MLTPDRLADIEAEIERAHTEVGEICRRTGPGRWRMSIPANPGRDSDLIISKALSGAEALLAEVKRLSEENERRSAVEMFARTYAEHCAGWRSPIYVKVGRELTRILDGGEVW